MWLFKIEKLEKLYQSHNTKIFSGEDKLKYKQLWNIITSDVTSSNLIEIDYNEVGDEFKELTGFRLRDAPEEAYSFIEEGEEAVGKRLVAKKGNLKIDEGEDEEREIPIKNIARGILSDYRYRPNDAEDGKDDITPLEYSKLPNANKSQFFINTKAYRKKDIDYGGAKGFDLPKRYEKPTMYKNKETGEQIPAKEYNKMLLDEKDSAKVQEIKDSYTKEIGESLSREQYEKRKESRYFCK